MNIPTSRTIPTAELSRIFNHTTATYKFYWFIGILDLLVKKRKTRINIWDIMIEMVANAWYPVCYFHLSFGKLESLYDAILKIQRERNVPINKSPSDLAQWLHDNLNDSFITDTLSFLMINVPYRFLSPWISTPNNLQMMNRSQSFENNCLYRLVKDNQTIWVELNDNWIPYLKTNYQILKDYTYWNLTLFLQTRNPNVPNIPNKLIKPERRNSLSRQHEYWDFVINQSDDFRCIYTNNPITIGHYDLDHFIPWSFVSHDQIWNLLPADGSINSSKSDKLPPLDKYLPLFALKQQKAIKIVLSKGYTNAILEDYISLGASLQELAEMDEEHLNDCFLRTYSPLQQIALNMGFEIWNN